jgi:hypothetical protein
MKRGRWMQHRIAAAGYIILIVLFPVLSAQQIMMP